MNNHSASSNFKDVEGTMDDTERTALADRIAELERRVARLSNEVLPTGVAELRDALVKARKQIDAHASVLEARESALRQEIAASRKAETLALADKNSAIAVLRDEKRSLSDALAESEERLTHAKRDEAIARAARDEVIAKSERQADELREAQDALHLQQAHAATLQSKIQDVSSALAVREQELAQAMHEKAIAEAARDRALADAARHAEELKQAQEALRLQQAHAATLQSKIQHVSSALAVREHELTQATREKAIAETARDDVMANAALQAEALKQTQAALRLKQADAATLQSKIQHVSSALAEREQELTQAAREKAIAETARDDAMAQAVRQAEELQQAQESLRVHQADAAGLVVRYEAVRRSVLFRFILLGLAWDRLISRFARRLRHGPAPRAFDRTWYLNNYPDVRFSGMDPYAHYRCHGASEGRDPNVAFSSAWYLKNNPDVAEAGICPLRHFEEFGQAEGRDPSPNFSLAFYQAAFPESAHSRGGALNHYLRYGVEHALPTLPPAPQREHILVVAYYCPTRAHAGGLRILDICSRIKAQRPDVAIDLFTMKRPEIDWNYDDVYRIFDNVYDSGSEDFTLERLRAVGNAVEAYSVVDFQFIQDPALVAGYRAIAARVIFTPMELLMRSYALDDPQKPLTADERRERALMTQREIELTRIVDRVICVSEPDAAFLRETTGASNVEALETGVSEIETTGPDIEAALLHKDALSVVFVAYFGSMTNVDSLRWYLNEVHPIVAAAVPRYRLSVVGRGDLSSFADQDNANLELVGEVPSVGPLIARAAIGIAPALGGAGFRGKINQYAAIGVPCVASPIAAEGFAYESGKDILVGATAREFAQSIIDLLQNPARREAMGVAARQRCEKVYSWKMRDSQIASIYALNERRATPALRRASKEPPPRILAVVPSYRHARYLAERIHSVLHQDYASADLVVIDDASPDDSHGVLQSLQRRYRFRYVRRSKNSGTPFSAWQFASKHARDYDYVWICESDDWAEAGFLNHALHSFESNPGQVLFYCNSHVIDSDSVRIGTTGSYFSDIWRDSRWRKNFTADGRTELVDYQRRGMIVPNMSSALIRADAFSAAWHSGIKRFRLTGDWLFIGRVLTHGSVSFVPAHFSNFRQHPQTARAQTSTARSQAEFILTKIELHRLGGLSAASLLQTLETDVTRFIHEDASAWQVVRQMWAVSPTKTISALAGIAFSVPFNPKIARLRRKSGRGG